MTENLLQAAQAGDTGPASRPAEVPEKFWDPERGTIRVDALLKSYRELERKLSARFLPPGADAPEEERVRFRRALGVPESPDEYVVECRHALCSPDREVNARLHDAGFTPEQVQVVYDLAAERLVPIVAEAAMGYEAERQLDRLRAEFGGEERFRRISKQIAAWGRANLPPPVFEALSTTADGVIALHRMMEKGEPPLARRSEQPETMDEGALRKMMRDPRYWRTREPDFVRRVTEGFRRLTGA
ncbi:capsid assembly protein [Muricoccus radiodurans]|uniref:capsid assembly protein n=1 Tax=Muricoccus radiodurans TaxID=2231721 RepID=UPI003CF19865